MNLHCNIELYPNNTFLNTHGSHKWSNRLKSSGDNVLCIPDLTHMCDMSRLSRTIWYNHCNNGKKKSYTRNRPWRPIRLWDVEAPTFSLDSRLTDGGKVVSLMRRPPFNPRKIPGTHFC
jgi:hypothetical protein